MLAYSVYVGGLPMVVFTIVAILMLIHHEYAHIRECERRGVKVNNVRFTWLGGLVNAEIYYANDAVPILAAGVINTGCYTFAFTSLLLIINYMGRNVWLGFNFANNPYLQLLNSIVLFSFIMLITNILPVSINSKKYGLILTDGWGAYKFRELRDEMWNNGMHEGYIYELDD
jgi:hypothetical protein